jgi:predicted metal-dependent HD superfamily phosphohydrolase
MERHLVNIQKNCNNWLQRLSTSAKLLNVVHFYIRFSVQPGMDFEGAKQFILHKQREQIPSEFAYHNIVHIEDVYRATLALGNMEKLNAHEQMLVSMAALFHDSGFMITGHNHEESSCQLAKTHLPVFGFTDADIDIICRVILATKMNAKPANLLEQIICDADLDYLGREDFEEISAKLYAEFLNVGLVKDTREFDLKQVAFFEKHQYHTSTARLWRNDQKSKNLENIKARLTLTNNNEAIG